MTVMIWKSHLKFLWLQYLEEQRKTVLKSKIVCNNERVFSRPTCLFNSWITLLPVGGKIKSSFNFKLVSHCVVSSLLDSEYLTPCVKYGRALKEWLVELNYINMNTILIKLVLSQKAGIYCYLELGIEFHMRWYLSYLRTLKSNKKHIFWIGKPDSKIVLDLLGTKH